MPSTSASASRARGVVEALGVHPLDLHAAAELEARVAQRLHDRQVGVLELDVLADQRDLDRVGAQGLAGAPHQLLPVAELRRRRLHPEVVEDEVVHALGAVDERHLVDVVHVARRDDRVVRQRGEQGDLLAHVLRQPALGAAHQHVRLDADAAQLVDRVLRRLGLQLAGMADVGHEREVDEHAAPAPGLDRELPDRLQERQRLDVAHRAADLGDHHVDVLALRDQLHAVLDLVGDVRDDLDGPAEVVAAALLADHRVVDRAGGHVGAARGVGVREALVVAEVEVGLRAVLGHEHLAVLERRHRARVHVDVRVELLDGDLQAARDEQAADRGRGDALAKGGDDSAGDEDESRAGPLVRHQLSLVSSSVEVRVDITGVTPPSAARGHGGVPRSRRRRRRASGPARRRGRRARAG